MYLSGKLVDIRKEDKTLTDTANMQSRMIGDSTYRRSCLTKTSVCCEIILKELKGLL